MIRGASVGRIVRGVGLVAALSVAAVLAGSRSAGADEPQPAVNGLNERCANRLSIAFLGKTAEGDLMTAPDPKVAIEKFVGSADFVERFSRFINSEFNPSPGKIPMGFQFSLEDAPYYLAKVVLAQGKPWSEMFLGKYDFVQQFSQASVVQDGNGLGYFRSPDWYARYEGNEPEGIKLQTAYRIMNNVVGLKLTAVTASPENDQTATGRQAAPCNQCHYNGWFALDKVASILPRKGQGFNAYRGGPREMLGGKQIANDEELVTALVESENFSVNACRLAFKYLYGREDNKCDGPVIDACVDTFKAQKTMQSALTSIAREPAFCD